MTRLTGKSIFTYRDVEHKVPHNLIGALRVYRVLQRMNREASCSGRFVRADAVTEVARFLSVSPETVRRALRQGEGVFWTFGKRDGLYLIGFQKVYKHFDAIPSQEPPEVIDADRIDGHISNYKGLVLAVSLMIFCESEPDVEVQRWWIAKHLKVSLPTLRKYAAAGWLTIQQQLEIVQPFPLYRGKCITLIGQVPMTLNREKGERGWFSESGVGYLVKQKYNRYIPCWTKEEDLLDDRRQDPLAGGALEWTGGASIYDHRKRRWSHSRAKVANANAHFNAKFSQIPAGWTF